MEDDTYDKPGGNHTSTLKKIKRERERERISPPAPVLTISDVSLWLNDSHFYQRAEDLGGRKFTFLLWLGKLPNIQLLTFQLSNFSGKPQNFPGCSPVKPLPWNSSVTSRVWCLLRLGLMASKGYYLENPLAWGPLLVHDLFFQGYIVTLLFFCYASEGNLIPKN